MIDLNFNHRPKLTEVITDLIDKALVDKEAEASERDYLGASSVGQTCARQSQLAFTQTPKDEGAGFSGRTLRWFEDGHAGEAQAAEWMREAGFHLLTHKRDGGQYGFSVANGKFKGHIDGFIIDGPDLPGLAYPCLWEHKRMGTKSFKQVEKQGVTKARPVYASQIALYQAYLELTTPCLFMATCRDTIDFYFELIPFDAGLAQEVSDRAVSILEHTQQGVWLPRIAETPDFFLCKRCDWKDYCWNAMKD